MRVLALGMEQLMAPNFKKGTGIAGTLTGDVRRQQGVEMQFPA